MDPRLTHALEGRYTIAREIGAGGMATVYLARDVKHDRDVALKVLKPELGAVLGVERFLSEIKTTAKLQHPHILPLLDSGDAAGLLFYVMPYVEGESLRDRLERERQLPIGDAVRIAREVASALDYAHRHGVIHRDIKPENVLLHDGQALVADFGIALAVQSAGGQRMTQTGLSLGTPQYMSPEQAMGEKIVDARSDIYALGAMTYEMLAGDPPFTGSSVQAIVARILNERPTPLHTLRDTVSPGVEQAIMTALAKLAADRFATAKEFADALVTTTPAIAQPGAPRSAGARSRLRDPVVIALTALLVATAAIAGVFWSKSKQAGDGETVRFAINLPRYVSVGGSIGSSVVISNDGRTIAYVGGSADGSTQQLFVRTVNDVTPRAIPGTEAAQRLFLSPVGSSVGFWAKGRLARAPLTGDEQTRLTDLSTTLQSSNLISGGSGFGAAAWSTRGVIVGVIGRGLATMPDTGGEVVPLTPPAAPRVPQLEEWPVVLADGITVLYTTRDSGGQGRPTIAAASLTDGRRALLGLPGTVALGVVDEFLVYGTAVGELMAVRFDARTLSITGTPVSVGSVGAPQLGRVPSVSLSATGTLVYRGGFRLSEMVTADRSGVVRVLMPESRAYSYPRISPDGKRVAFVVDTEGKRQIWLRDLAAQTQVRFTDTGDGERPEWAPDGKTLIYRGSTSGASSIWRRPADMSGPPELLFPKNREGLWEAVATPDGKGLVLQRDVVQGGAGGADIVYRAFAGDTSFTEVMATRAEETQARVSPDGRWVAYHTTASGGSEVAVTRLRGGGGHVVVSSGPGSEPLWSRDGKHLYYRDGTQIVEVTYAAAADFTVTSRRPLFADNYLFAPAPHANYDLSPDGETFLLLRPTEGQQITVAHNWRAELKRLMAAQGRP